MPTDRAPMLPGYTFDPRLSGGGRYRSLATGRTVARARVLELLDAQVNLRADRLARLTMDFTANRIGAQGWVETMRNELRRAALQNLALGSGGWDRILPIGYSRVGGILQADNRRLVAFAEDIMSGKLSDAQILNRLQMYLGNARRNFYEAERDVMRYKAADYQERRVLGIAEHCEDCIEMSHRSWQPFGTFPAPGVGSRCLTSCRCHLEYRLIKAGQSQSSA